MSTDHTTDRPELTPEERRVLAALTDFGQARAAGSSPWPGLDGAIRRDSRNRAIRRGAGGALAAVLAVAVVLPFSPVRVQPLDELAAALGLRAVRTEPAPTPDVERTPSPEPSPRVKGLGQGMLQDVTDDPTDYVDETGAPLPVPGGQRITDPAWLEAVSARALHLVTKAEDEGQAPAGRTAWAADDGTRTVALVGVIGYDEVVGLLDDADGDPWTGDDGSTHEPTDWIVLTGPTDARPEQLRIATIGPVNSWLSPVSADVVGPDTELVALFEPEAQKPRIARLPAVDKNGTVTTTWYAMTRVAPGWWLADLDQVAGAGYVIEGGGSGSTLLSTFWNQSPADGAEGVDARLAMPPFDRLGVFGYEYGEGDARFEVTVGGRTVRAKADLRVVGIATSSDSGWLMTGELRITEAPTAEQGGFPGLGAAGGRKVLDVLAAPATSAGGLPFVGWPVSDPETRFMRQVVVWAPDGVTEVRSGRARAKVAGNVAVLDVSSGAQRTAENTNHQSVLIEGLDAGGEVIARARVREQVSERFAGGPPNPHDGWPQTVIAWP